MVDMPLNQNQSAKLKVRFPSANSTYVVNFCFLIYDVAFEFLFIFYYYPVFYLFIVIFLGELLTNVIFFFILMKKNVSF